MIDTRGTLVMKFGGTSVGTVQVMTRVIDIISKARPEWDRLVVVISALSGVTDQLILSAVNAAHGDMNVYEKTLTMLHKRHDEMIDAFILEIGQKKLVRQEVHHLIMDFTHLCQAIQVLGEATPRALDAVAGIGERLSVRILAAALNARQVPAQSVDATKIIITDGRFQNAQPDFQLTEEFARKNLDLIFNHYQIPIVTGFIGATPNGIPTTLGRGGSDYSASILALVLKADEVWIWTDVDGVMTADPRLVPDARTIPQVSYREVAEMAYYGAKVLHPKSIHPVIEAGITLRVCNTFNAEGEGTRLIADHEGNGLGKVKAITAIRGLQLVTVAGRGMLGVPGVAGRIFSAVATTGISVPLIIESTSEQSICFAAPQEAVPEVIRTLKTNLSQDFIRGDIDQVWGSEEVDIITVICPGIRITPGIAGRIFGILGDAKINVLAISYGASDVSLNLVVSASDTTEVVNSLHQLVGRESSSG